MATPRIYLPVPLAEGTLVTLDDAQHHHLLTVLRIKNEENVILFNGLGGEYTGSFHSTKKKSQVKILHFQPVDRESPVDLHLGQGLARGARMDFVIQKATELGVTQITPLWTQNCAVKLDEARSQKRLEHWRKIAISACEQSGRTRLPVLHPVQFFDEWITTPFAGTSFLLTPTSEYSFQDALSNKNHNTPIKIAIGPESGWEKQEISKITNEVVFCRLGPRVLRTETAGMVALSILQNHYGDLR